MAEANSIVSSAGDLYDKLLFISSVVHMVMQASGELDVAWVDVMTQLIGEVVVLADLHCTDCLRVSPMLTYLQTGVVPESL